MSYQVLARKWRPRTFSEMVGQEHVLRALINALDHDRLHHAFLFTGTRGVGKTTIARILAKSLNCEQGVSSQPCGACGACREVDEGRFVDLIEVDAASRTKVEDTRELLENVQYAPTRGRYKVYLIDEVHMLSTHSFNALLKTLEEPPPHVKFLLATTDPQKLPVTILSRCLQFNLKRLPQDLIQRHLAAVLTQEAIAAEAAGLALVAQAADGSMRDALSLLDQAIAYGGGELREAEVRAMLGTIDQGHIATLLDQLGRGDAAGVLDTVGQLAEQAADFAAALGALLSLLHRVALAQAVPGTIGDDQAAERIAGLAEALSPEDVQLFYQIGVVGRRDLPLAPDARTGFEMTLLRMVAFRPAEGGAVQGAQSAPARAERRPSSDRQAAARPAAPAPAAAPGPAVTPAAGAPPEVAGNEWAGIVAGLGLTGLAQQLAVNCILKERDGERIHLVLAPSHGGLLNERQEQRLQQALQDHFGAPVKLRISVGAPDGDTPARLEERRREQRQATAEQLIDSDPLVRALQDTFNAKVDPNSVRPVDQDG